MDGITWHTLLLNTGLLSLLKCSDLRHFCPCELCQAMGTLGPMKILQNMEGGTFLWINCTSEGLGGEFLLIIIVAVLLTAFWGNFQKPQARWFLYVHFPARCFKKILDHFLDVFKWNITISMALEINMHTFLMNLSWPWIYILYTHLEHTVFIKASKANLQVCVYVVQESWSI